MWAYPTKLGQTEDSVVCSIKDNPELVVINLSCWGVRPELELESKHLHFHRILLHRYQNLEFKEDTFLSIFFFSFSPPQPTFFHPSLQAGQPQRDAAQ